MKVVLLTSHQSSYNGESGHSHAFCSSFNDCDSYLVLYYVTAFTSLLVFFEWIFSDVTLLCNHRKRNISSQKSLIFSFEKCYAFCATPPLFSLGIFLVFRQRSLKSVNLPISSVSAVEFECYRLKPKWEVIESYRLRATSRHLSSSQPTTGTQCRITFILILISCRQADICFCFCFAQLALR